MSSQKRLFIGIPIPDPVRRTFAGLDPEIEGLRWLDPSTYHITLCFIGETEMDPEEEVMPLLRKEAERTPPFSMSFEGLTEAPAKRPYMVWARYRNVSHFQDLHERLFENFLPDKGKAREQKPHITLARAKRGKRVERKDLPDPPELPDLNVDQAVLWHSELRKGGAVHHELGKASLRGTY
ncbi:MAG: RNA 2',3'-cyclic phosphodiesterase [Flavobacteriales bacterium]